MSTRSWIVILLVLLSACSGGGDQQPMEQINGITVPPAPDVAANRATIAGVDSDRNGIRDDVDRMLATDFGKSPAFHEEAVSFARTEQAALLNPTAEAVEAHIDLLRCTRDPKRLADFDRVTLAAVDTPVRKGAYGRAFAGVVISSRGCK